MPQASFLDCLLLDCRSPFQDFISSAVIRVQGFYVVRTLRRSFHDPCRAVEIDIREGVNDR